MRSRLFGRRLLPATLAAATVTAVAAPASAQEAPPPAPETYTEDDCAQALNILSYFKLLPDQPDVGRALCSMNRQEQQTQSSRPDQDTQDQYTQDQYTQQDYTNEISSEHTTDSGQTVEKSNLLSLPVEWPKSLTVYLPTLNDQWFIFQSKKS